MKLSATPISPPLKYSPVWQDSKAEGKTGGDGMRINILKQARCMEFSFTFHTMIQYHECFCISRNYMALLRTRNTGTVMRGYWCTQLKGKSLAILSRKEDLELRALIIWQVITSKGQYIIGHQV